MVGVLAPIVQESLLISLRKRNWLRTPIYVWSFRVESLCRRFIRMNLDREGFLDRKDFQEERKIAILGVERMRNFVSDQVRLVSEVIYEWFVGGRGV